MRRLLRTPPRHVRTPGTARRHCRSARRCGSPRRPRRGSAGRRTGCAHARASRRRGGQHAWPRDERRRGGTAARTIEAAWRSREGRQGRDRRPGDSERGERRASVSAARSAPRSVAARQLRCGTRRSVIAPSRAASFAGGHSSSAATLIARAFFARVALGPQLSLWLPPGDEATRRRHGVVASRCTRPPRPPRCTHSPGSAYRLKERAVAKARVRCVAADSAARSRCAADRTAGCEGALGECQAGSRSSTHLPVVVNVTRRRGRHRRSRDGVSS